jgi:hypothetical protein
MWLNSKKTFSRGLGNIVEKNLKIIFAFSLQKVNKLEVNFWPTK